MFELTVRLALIFLIGLAPPEPASAAKVVRGQVVSVNGGDALTLIDAQQRAHRLKLAFIDAPALDQPFGDEAQAALAAMVLGRQVTAQLRGNDVDQPTSAELVEPHGHVVNLEMVKRGLAWIDDFEAQAKAERDQYQIALAEAQRARQGMWALNRVEHPRDRRARAEQVLRVWLIAITALAAFTLLGLLFSTYDKPIKAWLDRQDAITKASAEVSRLARAQAEAEQAEKDRTREVADRELNRLASVRREAEKRNRT